MNDFSQEIPNEQLAHAIANEARVKKEEVVKAKNLHAFDLTGYPETRSVNGRLTFPGRIEGLGYDPAKVMQAIIGGDMVDEATETVQCYYPHERQGRLVGKTTFNMKLDDAVRLLKQCGQELGIPEYMLRPAAEGYISGMSFLGKEDFNLRAGKTITMALASKL